MNVKELPLHEQPMFKLKQLGAGNLSNAELLQIITGAKNINLSYDVLSNFEVNSALKNVSIEELQSIEGVTPLMASRISAAAELSGRMSSSFEREKTTITCPDDVVKLLRGEIEHENQECFYALFLNAKNKIIGKELISKGGATSAIVDARDVFRPAIKKGALSVIAIHNHPSGEPEPSDSDIEVTKKLSKAGELIGIELMDHIIIGKGSHVSLKSKKIDCFEKSSLLNRDSRGAER